MSPWQLIRLLFVVMGTITALTSAVMAVNIETVPVGNPGNAPDKRYSTTGYGGVGYVYRIGKYEVTAGQYTEFLNAVAKADVNTFYDPSMSSTEWPDYGCNIQRHGSSGSYTYSVAADWANRPVNIVRWDAAARFANWLHNGQPSGAPSPTTTEDGSYDMSGNYWLKARKAGATWVVPSEDEWYKAAYHKNDGVTGNYWDYPTGTDSSPSNALINPDPGNSANFKANGSFTIGTPYYRTPVGAFENSRSPYGTFDQGGNVFEWNEAVSASVNRCFRGGSFDGGVSGPSAFLRQFLNLTSARYYIGFRVGLVLQPSSIVRFDFDKEGDVDPADFAVFESCGSGPAIPRAATPACAAADADSDGDVDQDDFGVFQRCFSGANKLADPSCTN